MYTTWNEQRFKSLQEQNREKKKELKAAKATRNAQIRKCMGALWDALTTVKYLLQHYQEPTTDEQEILVTRLEATLKALGGEREKVDAKAIEELLKSRRGAS